MLFGPAKSSAAVGRAESHYAAFVPHNWSLGARLAIAVFAVALPLNLVLAFVIIELKDATRSQAIQGLTFNARTLASAVDAEFSKYLNIARLLSTSPLLLDVDIQQFDNFARKAVADQKNVYVLVGDLEGQQLVNTGFAPNTQLPRRSPQAWALQTKAQQTQSMVIGDVFYGPGVKDWVVNIEIPVARNGRPFRELVLSIGTRYFQNLLNTNTTPRGYVTGIMDNSGRFVARYPNYEQAVGQLASDGWRSYQGQVGVWEINSLEGNIVVTATDRSALTGWSVGVGINKADLEAAVSNATRIAVIASVIVSLVTIALGFLIARGVTGPIARLQLKAAKLFHNEPISEFRPSLPEVRSLWSFLRQIAEQRNEQEHRLVVQQKSMRTLFESAPNGFVVVNAEGTIQLINSGAEKLFGYKSDELIGKAVECLLPERHTQNHQSLRSTYQQNPQMRMMGAGRDLRGRRKDGSEFPVEIGLSPVDFEGAPAVLATVVDISARKRLEEQERLIVGELKHRTRNIFGVMQALVGSTLKETNSVVEAKNVLIGRINALSQAYSLLADSAYEGAPLDKIIRSAHSILDSPRVAIKGCEITVGPRGAQQFVMIAHELATNALKYGALSSSEGRISISGAIDPSGDGSFLFSWKESGGPPVSPPTRKGFGSVILRDAAQLFGLVTLDYPTDGFVYQLRVKLDALEPQTNTGVKA